MNWDGSHLGEIGRPYNQFAYGKDLISEFQLATVTGIVKITGILIKAEGKITLVIELLKHLFSIERRKFHLCLVDQKPHVLFYVPMIGNAVVYEVPLSDLPRDHELRSCPIFQQRVKELIVFSDICSIKGNNEDSIRIRNSGTVKIPVSYSELNFFQSNCESIMSKELLKKWFRDSEGYQDTIEALLTKFEINTGTNRRSISATLEKYLSQLVPDFSWYSNLIKRRINTFSEC